MSFASRHSILLWSISHYRAHLKTTRQRLARLPHGVPVHDLRTAEQVEAFLAAASGPRRPADAWQADEKCREAASS